MNQTFKTGGLGLIIGALITQAGNSIVSIMTEQIKAEKEIRIEEIKHRANPTQEHIYAGFPETDTTRTVRAIK